MAENEIDHATRDRGEGENELIESYAEFRCTIITLRAPRANKQLDLPDTGS